MRSLRVIWKQLRCQHEYMSSHGLHCYLKGGQRGEKVYSKKMICPNCGKTKHEFIGVLPPEIKESYYGKQR